MRRVARTNIQWPNSWRFAVPLIQPALEQQERHGYTLNDVYAMLTDGRCQLWIGKNSAAVTHIAAQPNGNVCTVWLAGGELQELVDALNHPDSIEWARSLGCRSVEIHGREGWVKPLKTLGYTRSAVTYTKSLEN